jgi:hypothetical protein
MILSKIIPEAKREKVGVYTVPFELPEQFFDAYNKQLPVQQALGSKRGKEIQEVTEIRSTNFTLAPDGSVASGWRLTRRGLETVATGVFPPGSILFADIQNIATGRILGRTTASSGVIEQLTPGSSLVLTALTLVRAALTGDVTASQDSNATTIANDAVTNAKMANMAQSTIKGRAAGAGTGDPTDLSASQVNTILDLDSGTYSPTRSNETNLDSNISFASCKYSRVGSLVTVSGRFTANPTTTLTATSFEMTLPISSNIGAAGDVSGTAFNGTIQEGAEVVGVAANDTAKIQWIATDVTSTTWSFIFHYRVI